MRVISGGRSGCIDHTEHGMILNGLQVMCIVLVSCIQLDSVKNSDNVTENNVGHTALGMLQ